ncbi:DUF3782 domain-containing protein [Infirmifilum lucidum]|uniref:DUF3782 domain-containing protein n=1 Tax=Infirmifilum lucidum TaxID=2776706 RepID=A0A7L9FH42_9CREN|nr:DUF3782 domain-containing protein [Infirmifilum lucidum]QOJ79037.1 DUF3782 domain-containing protein [Infirmifilum lucidum]
MEPDIERVVRALREEVGKLSRMVDALCAMYGLISEEEFREEIRRALREEHGLVVEKWEYFDSEGYVYSVPFHVEVYVVACGPGVVLVEVLPHARRGDVAAFKRKAELYERVTGRKPYKLVIASPHFEDRAIETCKVLGIEPCTGA